MKRLILITLTALALIALVPSASLAYTSTGTGFPLIVVNNGPGSQSDPHVSGHYATYTDDASGTETIKYFDFATQTNSAVPTAAGALDKLPDVFGSTIVFTRVNTSTGDSAISSYPVGGTPSEVAPVALPHRRNPAIGGSTIAWEDIGVSANSNPDLVVDSNGTLTQLTNDEATNSNQNPNVSPDGSTIVWEKCGPTGSCDIYAAVKSGSSWTVSPVATTAANEKFPDTNGSIVVYSSDAGGSRQIHFRSLSGGTDQTIALPAGGLSASHPTIAGDFIAFEAFDAGQSDIWVYDVADNSLRQITNTPTVNESYADVSVATSGGTSTATVVWQFQDPTTGLDLYASQFTVGAPASTDQFLQPLVQSTDPANPVINTGKNGKVIPVKVQLSQGGSAITDQNAPGPVTIAVSKLASCSTSAGSDPVTTYADAGQSSAGTNQFNYDSLAQAWVYNLDTKALGLTTGNCYRIDVSVNGTQIANAFAVFQPTK